MKAAGMRFLAHSPQPLEIMTHRPKKNKKPRIADSDIRELIPDMGLCMATNDIVFEGYPVGVMIRDAEDENLPMDSGWVFMSGEETEEYQDNPKNWGLYEVNTICNYDPAIIPHVNAPRRTTLVRVEETDEFVEEPYVEPGE
jgi:hypothetical protein